MTADKSREQLRRDLYLLEMSADPNDRRHGTITGYSYGCRCHKCMAARKNRDKPRDRRVAV